MLEMEGVMLLSVTAWYPSTLKFRLVYNETKEGRLLSKEVCSCFSPVGLRGDEVWV